MAKRDVELVTEGKDGTDVLLVFASTIPLIKAGALLQLN